MNIQNDEALKQALLIMQNKSNSEEKLLLQKIEEQLLHIEGFKPRKTQILAAFYIYYKYPSNCLLQVLPSEGKTYIIAIVAILLVKIKKCKVDIVTSSEYLAKRDSEKMLEFYKALNISCSHVCIQERQNSKESVELLKAAYGSQIIYTTSFLAQSDYLYDTFMLDGRKGERELSAVIIDEVDSTLIDRAFYSCQLTNSVPGMEFTTQAILSIYKFTQQVILISDTWYAQTNLEDIKKNNQEFHDGIEAMLHLAEIKEGLILIDKENLSNFIDHFEKLKVPQFVQMENKKWKSYCDNSDIFKVAFQLRDNKYQMMLIFEVDSNEFLKQTELTLKGMISHQISQDENCSEQQIFVPLFLTEYVLSKLQTWLVNAVRANNSFHKGIHYHIIKETLIIIDYQNTGELQFNSQYGDNLHQFLCIKENLPLTPESFSSTHLSTKQFYLQYQTLIGLSGTIGTSFDRGLLKQQYKVDILNIPSHKYSKFIKYQGQIYNNEEEYKSAIEKSIEKERSKQRAVLILCESIKMTEYLTRNRQNGYKIFSRSDDQEQVDLMKQPIQPKEVIFATLVGARGADFDASQVEQFGGIHVILAFMPPNKRVQKQGYLRTARAGNSGSGEIICLNQDGQSYQNFKEYQKRRNLISIGKSSQSENDFQSLEKKDQKFREFLQYYNEERTKLIPDPKEQPSPKAYYQLRELQYIFGLFQQKTDYENFELNEELIRPYKQDMHKKIFKNPIFLILQANRMLLLSDKKPNHDEIIDLYNKAIQLEPSFITFSAYINIASVKMKFKKQEGKDEFRKGISLLDLALRHQYSISALINNVNSPLSNSTQQRLEILQGLKQYFLEANDILRKDNEFDSDIQPLSVVLQSSNFPNQLLTELQEIGLLGGLKLSIIKPFWTPILIGVIGIAQIAGGAVLICCSGPFGMKIGQALISEGISDILYAVRSGMNGDCNWKDYGINKAISLAVTVACMGIAKLYSCAKQAYTTTQAVNAGSQLLLKSSQEAAKLTFKNVACIAAKEAGKQIVLYGAQQLVNEGINAVLQQIKDKLSKDLIIIIDEKIRNQAQKHQTLKNNCESLVYFFGNASETIQFIEKESRILLASGNNVLMQLFQKSVALLSRVSQLTECEKFKDIMKILNAVSEITSAFECLNYCSEICSNFIDQLACVLQKKLQQFNEIKKKSMVTKQSKKESDEFLNQLTQRLIKMISEALINKVFQKIVEPLAQQKASELSCYISGQMSDLINSLNPELFAAIDQKRFASNLERLESKNFKDVKGNDFLAKEALSSVLQGVGQGVLREGLKYTCQQYTGICFKQQHFYDQMLSKYGLTQIDCKSIIFQLEEQGIITSGSIISYQNQPIKLSSNYKHFTIVIEEYLKDQLQLSGEDIIQSIQRITDEGLQEGINGLEEAKQNQTIINERREHHDLSKVDANYVDILDIQDYANKEGKRIIIIKEDGKETIIDPIDGKVITSTHRIVYKNSHYTKEGAQNPQETNAQGDCFFYAVGESDPADSKRKLYEYRQTNQNAHYSTKVSELFSEENAFKGSGIKKTNYEDQIPKSKQRKSNSEEERKILMKRENEIDQVPRGDNKNIAVYEGAEYQLEETSSNLKRVTEVTATIYKDNPKQGSSTNFKARQYAKSMGRASDDAGHIISCMHGGTGRHAVNIMPQNSSKNRGEYRLAESFLRFNDREVKAEVQIKLIYNDDQTLRPSKTKYSFKTFDNKRRKIGSYEKTVENP